MNKMAEVAATKATWGSVTGTGKPADNATVGATIGTNVDGSIAVGSDFIDPGALHTAESALNAYTQMISGAGTSSVTLTLTTVGGPVQILAYGKCTLATSNSASLRISKSGVGNLIQSASQSFGGDGSVIVDFPLMFVDTPAAGTHSYTITLDLTGTPNSVFGSVLETKR
jgi:hypothetical protein